jgi:hypothetical protein
MCQVLILKSGVPALPTQEKKAVQVKVFIRGLHENQIRLS